MHQLLNNRLVSQLEQQDGSSASDPFTASKNTKDLLILLSALIGIFQDGSQCTE